MVSSAPPAFRYRRLSLLLAGITVVLCILAAAAAGIYAAKDFDGGGPGAIDVALEGPGLRPIGHYGILSANPSQLVHIGRLTGNEVVIPAPNFADEAALASRVGDSWIFTPAPGGNPVRAAEERTFGVLLPLSGNHQLQRGSSQIAVSVAKIARLAISSDQSDPSDVLVPLRQSESQTTSTLALDVCSPTAILIGPASGSARRCMPGQMSGILQERESTKVASGNAIVSVYWNEEDPRTDPWHVRVSIPGAKQRDAVLWPGGRIPLPEVEAALSLSANDDGARLVPTSPGQPPLLVTGGGPHQEATGVQRKDGEILRLGPASFIIRTLTISSLPALQIFVLYRVKGDFWQLDRFTLASLSGRLLPWRALESSSLYQPYRRIVAPRCDTLDPAPALWLPQDPKFVTPPATPSLMSTVAAAVTQSIRTISLSAPSWVPASNRGRGAFVCLQQGNFIVGGVDERNASVSPPVDLVYRRGSSAPETGPFASVLTLESGDVIYLGGQVYELVDDARFGSVHVLFVLIPFVFVATALPLACFLGITQRHQLAHVSKTGTPQDLKLRRFTVLTPILSLPAIVGLMTIGGLFHLRLAADSRLVSHVDYLTTFVLANMAALALATALVVWRLNGPARNPGIAIRLALLALAFGFASSWLDAVMGGNEIQPRHVLLLSPQPSSVFLLFPIILLFGVVILGYAQDAKPMKGLAQRLIRPKAYLKAGLFEAYRKFTAAPEKQLEIVVCQEGRVSSIRKFPWNFGKAVFGHCLFFGLFVGLPAAAMGFVGAGGVGREVGKELVPLAVVLCAAIVVGQLSHFIQASPEGDSFNEDVRGAQWQRIMPAALSGIVFAIALGAQSRILPYVYEPFFLWLSPLVILASVIGLSLSKRWYPTAALLRTALPFFLVLLITALTFRDVGSVLVWAWVLSIVMAWTLVINAFALEAKGVFGASLGAVLGSVALVLLPLSALAICNAFSVQQGQFGILHHGLSRFGLVAAPFYYDTGEWAARAQLIAADLKPVLWIENMNSDLALNALHHLLPTGVKAFATFFFILTACLTAAFAETYRRGALTSEPSIRARRFGSAFVLCVALFGLGMLVLVHIGASVFDLLPLTGVPCPWLSNSNVVHASFTCLVMYAVLRASDVTTE